MPPPRHFVLPLLFLVPWSYTVIVEEARNRTGQNKDLFSTEGEEELCAVETILPILYMRKLRLVVGGQFSMGLSHFYTSYEQRHWRPFFCSISKGCLYTEQTWMAVVVTPPRAKAGSLSSIIKTSLWDNGHAGFTLHCEIFRFPKLTLNLVCLGVT